MEEACSKRIIKDCCPGHYDGCFAEVNGATAQITGDCGNCRNRWCCEEEPTTCHMVERQKAAKEMEQHSYNFTTKFVHGDKVYIIGQSPVQKTCPMCNGKRLYEGERCPACKATGVIEMERKEWNVLIDPFVLDHFRVTIGASGVIKVRYHGHCGFQSLNRAEENLFETVEAAQAECNRRNLVRVETSLANIKISSCFAGTVPAASKLAARVDEYKKTGKFTTEIYVNKDMELWDGYTTYMVCRMLGIKTIKVVVKERAPKAATKEADANDGRRDG